MNHYRLYYCVVLGIITSAVFCYVYGESGIKNYQSLKSYQEEIIENIVVLSEENALFNDTFRALRTNHNLVSLQARQLGYYRKNESVIHFSTINQNVLNNFRSIPSAFISRKGPVLPRNFENQQGNKFNSMAIGLTSGFILFLINTLNIYGKLIFKKTRKKIIIPKPLSENNTFASVTTNDKFVLSGSHYKRDSKDFF